MELENPRWNLPVDGIPFPREGSTMVPSPTGRSAIVIGGYVLIELSGDSIRSLKWTILDQRLQYGVFEHVSFQITHVAYDCLNKDGV